MKISVIVPVYRVEATLARCVDSIIRQNYTDFEIILVDDGSPDSSGKICDELAASDSRIKVIHKENGGVSSARNAGLDIAQGDYVCFIDSDDYVADNYLELMYSAAARESADIVIGGFEYVFPDGKCIKETLPAIVHDSGSAVHGLFRESKNGLYVLAWNKLYKKELWEEERFPVGRLHEDEFVAHRLLYKSKKTVMIEDVVYYYSLNPQSIMHNRDEKSYCDFLDALQERKAFFIKEKERILVKKSGELLCRDILFMIFYKEETSLMPVLQKKAKKLYRRNFHYVLRSERSYKEKKYFTLYFISPKLESLYVKLRSMKNSV